MQPTSNCNIKKDSTATLTQPLMHKRHKSGISVSKQMDKCSCHYSSCYYCEAAVYVTYGGLPALPTEAPLHLITRLYGLYHVFNVNGQKSI